MSLVGERGEVTLPRKPFVIKFENQPFCGEGADSSVTRSSPAGDCGRQASHELAPPLLALCCFALLGVGVSVDNWGNSEVCCSDRSCWVSGKLRVRRNSAARKRSDSEAKILRFGLAGGGPANTIAYLKSESNEVSLQSRKDWKDCSWYTWLLASGAGCCSGSREFKSTALSWSAIEWRRNGACSSGTRGGCTSDPTGASSASV